MKSEMARSRAAGGHWRDWGPYLAERAWGTVREDYSADGSAWDSFSHDQARSRAYRWSEDGLGGVCDDQQRFCFALALWNGVDPILKERLFGLTGSEGNHGEDVKEYWWYLDSTPTHSWMRWRYHYPQNEFPYGDLVSTNRWRSRDEPEYELIDTGVFAADRYWAVSADYAKAGPHDLYVQVQVENKGPEAATVHVLPTLWFRNTWAWEPSQDRPAPWLSGSGARLAGEHPELGRIVLSGDGDPVPLVCDNETNAMRLWGMPGRSRYPKDGINDHVVAGAATVAPDGRGTKGALHYTLTVPAGGAARIRLRLTGYGADGPDQPGSPHTAAVESAAGDGPDGFDGPGRSTGLDESVESVESVEPVESAEFTEFDAVMAARRSEADEFFADLTPSSCTPQEALVLRQAVAGLMWSKQFYHYDFGRWLSGDPGAGTPPARAAGRNAHWRHLAAHDVISMPDTWEYPWFAAWDLAFHSVALACVDPGFAKEQLLLLLHQRYMHRDGRLPAFEWAFGDSNPPVQAWAALRVFALDGGRDTAFLKSVFHRLLMNFTWWVNRADTDGDNIFEGGFLGLDNIAPIDRTGGVPPGGVLEQSDGTAWMAMYALDMMDIALILAREDAVYGDLVLKFLDHFADIVEAAYSRGLWSEEDDFFYDVLRASGRSVPLRVRSVVGLLPLCANTRVPAAMFAGLPQVAERLRRHGVGDAGSGDGVPGGQISDGDVLLAMVGPDRLPRVLRRMLDEHEFLSDHGLRALSQAHRDQPFTLTLPKGEHTVGYEPAESRTAVFGGNSNWRGPVWFPLNYLIIEALDRYREYLGDTVRTEYPTGSGREATLSEVADDLSRRLLSLFLDDDRGERPVLDAEARFQRDSAWHDLIPFHEYFHGDTGAGLGASHQTGWTALAINLMLRNADRAG